MIRASTPLPLALAAASFLSLGDSSIADELSGDRPPNIVLILIDDLGYADLGCFGSTSNQTPNLDRLAAEGLRLTDFHSNGPMCSATRAALLTGRYQNRFGRSFEAALDEDRDHDIGLPMEAVTIPEALKDLGYATGLFGKWHLGYQAPFLPTRQGFDEFVGLLTGDGDHHSHISRSGGEDWWIGERIDREEGYSVDLITDHSVSFMQRHRDRPFFLLVSHLAIHFPWQGPDEGPHRRLGQDYRPSGKLGPHGPGEVRPVVREMIEAVDGSVGTLVEALRRLELDRRTLVFFTSDNGGYLHYGGRFAGEISDNGPFRGQKGDVFEGGHRVPAIAWWPGRIEPEVSDAPAMTMDLMPTFVDLAGGPPPTPPTPTDGLSLAPMLLDRLPLPDRPLFWRKATLGAARLGPWKLVLDLDDRRPMLFNLDDDPGESVDRAEADPHRVSRLLDAFNAWQLDVDGIEDAPPSGDPEATDTSRAAGAPNRG